jgi:hypothetical protein
MLYYPPSETFSVPQPMRASKFRNDSRESATVALGTRHGATPIEVEKCLAVLRIKPTEPAVLQELMDRVKAKQTQAVSLRIPVSDIDAAKKIG